jgi:hypothetical protein
MVASLHLLSKRIDGRGRNKFGGLHFLSSPSHLLPGPLPHPFSVLVCWVESDAREPEDWWIGRRRLCTYSGLLVICNCGFGRAPLRSLTRGLEADEGRIKVSQTASCVVVLVRYSLLFICLCSICICIWNLHGCVFQSSAGSAGAFCLDVCGSPGHIPDVELSIYAKHATGTQALPTALANVATTVAFLKLCIGF